MATRIRLMRLGKMRAPHYRVIVVDSRAKRDGRSIETIGKYHPKEDPSYIEIDSERALYWLRVGAQPSEAVEALLKVTGAWQEFKGLPAPPPMLVAAPKADKRSTFETAAKAAAEGKHEEAPAKKAPAKKAAKPKSEEAATEAAEAAPAEAASEAADSGAEKPEPAEAAVAEAGE